MRRRPVVAAAVGAFMMSADDRGDTSEVRNATDDAFGVIRVEMHLITLSLGKW